MLLRKTKVYLDTSVIGFYFAEDTPEKMIVCPDSRINRGNR